MKRVELRPGVLSHACTACGRWCRDCRHTAYVPERCVGCAAPYRDNGPAEDGRVYCRGEGCGKPFPAALPDGVAAYPRLCRSCRERAAEGREEAAEHRALDRSVGVPAVLARTPRPTAPDPLAERRPGRPRTVPPEHAPPPDPDAPIRRGFRPRAPEADRRAKRPSEYGGEGL